MIVFKNYFKIVKRHIGLIILFSAISIVIAVLNTNYSEEGNYVNIKSKVGIINNDNSNLVQNFVDYLEKISEIKEINDDKKEIQDALYNNIVDTVLIIPQNFTEQILNGNEPTIEIKKSTKNYSETVEVLVNKYFKIVNIYSKVGMSEDEIINNISKNFEEEINVKIANKQNLTDLSKIAIYYSFENYALLSIFIYIIGTIMCIFNKETINRRNTISKIKPQSLSGQLFLGHLSLTLVIWFIFAVISVVLYKDLMFSFYGLLLIINSLIFAITSTSLAYLIGTLIKNENVISGIQNILALGLSFISGCFVPAEWLDKNIVNFSKCFPSYWYIHGNYEIVKISEFNFESLKPILQYYIIIMIFGVGYFATSRVIIRKKSKKSI